MKKLGQILVEQGKLSERDVERSLLAQVEMGGLLGQVFVQVCTASMPPALRRDQSFSSDAGFTVLELLVVISIVAMLLAVSVPASSRFYESMQYRQAIQDVVSLLASARHRAISTGKAQDVVFDTEYKRVTLHQDIRQLPESFTVLVSAASELGGQSQGVIRFYPEGGSSGGDVELARPDQSGVKITVDWLVGRVTQQPYAFN